MTLRVRVLSSKPMLRGRPVPEVVYNAEVYDDQDPFAKAVWGCGDDHPSHGLALRHGNEWLADRNKTAK